MEKLSRNQFFEFRLQNQIWEYFHYYIRNQRVKIHGYTKF